MATDPLTWFASPAWLALLAALPVLGLLALHAQRRRRQALASLGQPYAVARLRLAQPGRRGRREALFFLGVFLLILGAAGPQWGRAPGAVASSHRDLMLVLDVSRSMGAEQPSRFQRGLRALDDLAESLAERGGPRVALVVFAAHPKLVFPMTADYGHLQHALTQIDLRHLSPELRPQSGDVSGTRIGDALRFALARLDSDSGNAADVLLLSDGDDPAGDEEWAQGAESARRLKVPVHVVALGEPAIASAVPVNGGEYLFEGKPVRTRPNEKVLKEIARRTEGAYIPAFTSDLPLGKLLPSILAGGQRGPRDAGEQGTLLVLQPRQAWFLGPALMLLAASVLTGERRPARRPEPTATPAESRGAALLRLALVPVLVALVSAGPLPSDETMIREGTQLFDQEKYEEALAAFTRAEAVTADPGLVAFNKAGALYRLGRFAEASLHYRRCLEDDLIPAERRVLAFFQMGNAQLQESAGIKRDWLEQAIASYRECLLRADEAHEPLRGDARFNLELARLLWLKTKVTSPDPPNKDKQPGKEPKNKETTKPKEPPKDGEKIPANGSDPEKNGKPPEKGGDRTKGKKLSPGPVTVLPDDKELVPLSPQEAKAHVQAAAQRLLEERRLFQGAAAQTPEGVRDW